MARIFNPVLIALVAIAINVHGFPLEKRIAQTISDSTTKWEAACVRIAQLCGLQLHLTSHTGCGRRWFSVQHDRCQRLWQPSCRR